MCPNRLTLSQASRFAFSLFLLFALTVWSCSGDEDLQEVLQQLEEEGASEEEPTDQDEGSGDEGSGDEGSGDEGSGEEGSDEENSDEESSDECPSQVSFFFEEKDGLVSVEFEDNEFDSDWELRNDATGTSGEGYRVWIGNQTLGQPGNGLVVFPIAITKTGTYRFVWNSSFRQGNQGSEHNDSWLRFADAADFFGSKNDGASIVYPKGTGKTPNPEGSSADGWFKIYRSGNNNDFKWQSSTSDNDAHNIFVTFDTPGIYTMEVSARSSFHGIDRFMLFHSDMSFNEALGAADTFSVKKTCP